jgi:hypothetical protein
LHTRLTSPVKALTSNDYGAGCDGWLDPPAPEPGCDGWLGWLGPPDPGAGCDGWLGPFVPGPD